MILEPQNATLLNQAEQYLSQLSQKRLHIVVNLLACLVEQEADEGNTQPEEIAVSQMQELSVDELKQSMEQLGLRLTERDVEVVQTYLATELKWKDVYHRLANS